MADQVVAAGVKQIEGDVVADDSYFDLKRFPPGWTVDDTVWNYGAAVSAIAVNDNTFTLQVTPGKLVGMPALFGIEPWSGLYTIRNDAVTSITGVPAQLQVAREPDSRIVHLGGTLPLDSPPRSEVLAVAEPAESAAALFMHLLTARGVEIYGHSRAHHADDPASPHAGQTGLAPSAVPTVLAEHLSPPLIQDVRVTNKLSLNLHAELLLRVAAKEKAHATAFDDALKFAAQFRQSIGLANDDVILTDGSGLSRGDLVTPQSVVQLLAYAMRQPWGVDFAASLPISGVDGTLESRMRNTSATGRIHAKTGLVEHVAGLSGYATSVGGGHLIFSIFGNNTGTQMRDATAVIDQICVAMVDELGTEGKLPDNKLRKGPPGAR